MSAPQTAPATADEEPLVPGIWRPVRLQTLVRLRWMAVTGQFAAILVVALVFSYPLPLVPALIVIGASVTLNLVLTLRFGAGFRLHNRFAAELLAFDLLQLFALLGLTGGL